MLRFGTDGIRGDADAELTSATVAALGRAAARVFGVGAPFLIGHDPRESAGRVVADLARGLAAEGAAAEDAGMLPTPAIAFASQQRHAPAAMVSASHNRWQDNGVKLFAPGGLKLDDDRQASVERWLATLTEVPVPSSEVVVGRDTGARDRYVDHVVGALEGRDLGGLRVVVDCANGAASEIAPEVFHRAGASVTVLHAAPDGRNINDGCGSTDPAALQRAVVAGRADLGLALDGDADRCVAVDATGDLVDGDQIMVAIALDRAARGLLPSATVVVTVMSNLGLRLALAERGIAVHETPVGDRNVLAALERHGYSLGGEQSGHLIFRDLATTGDGILAGALLADLVARTGRSLRDHAAAMTRLPQVLDNVRVDAPLDLAAADGLWRVVREIEAELGARGRVLVRASGTEPLVRIMVEAPADDLARAAVHRLRRAVETAAGAP